MPAAPHDARRLMTYRGMSGAGTDMRYMKIACGIDRHTELVTCALSALFMATRSVYRAKVIIKLRAS